jgi:hypothetical protein
VLGLEPIDWVARTRKRQQDANAKREKQRAERAAERKLNTTPSHALQAYAGTYEHPAYGRLTVRQASGVLDVSYEAFTVRLKHFHYDVFEVEDTSGRVPLSGRITFLMDKKGDIDRMAVPFEPNVADIEFTRVKTP